MRSLRACLLVLGVVLAVAAVSARRVSVSSEGSLEQSPAAAARPLVKARVSTRVASTTAPAKFDLSGKFWYLDRDKKLPHLPATLACTANCKSPNPTYKATFTGISGIVFGVLDVNSNYVGFGSGPAPAIIGACSTDFTIILENDRAVGNVFAAYAPCGTKFQGGTSIYTKNEGGFFASLKRDLMNDVRIWQQVPPKVVGRYNLHDRNVASTNEPLTLTCVKDCENSKTPTYKGVFGPSSFTVKFAPDGYAGFGTLDVLKNGAVCGQTQFTLIVPPKGLSDGAAFLAAAKPLPACGFTGQALRID